MGFWQAVMLILKYFPIVVDLVKKLDEQAEEMVLDMRVNKANKKIDLIFSQKGNEAKRAGELNDVFRK